MAELNLDLRNFEPRWAGIVGIETTLPGRSTGYVRFDGIAGGRFTFDTDLSHALPGQDPSLIAGGGMVDLHGEREIDLSFEFSPLVLAIVDPLLPEGVSVLSEVRGPFAASGPLDDLQINTDLQTPRGQLQFDGRFDLVSDAKTYDATLLARDIQLSEWIESGPTTRLAVEGRVDGTGTDPATLDARFDLVVLPSLFEGARVDSSIVRFTLADGLATADTFAIRTRVGTRGWPGLVRAHRKPQRLADPRHRDSGSRRMERLAGGGAQSGANRRRRVRAVRDLRPGRGRGSGLETGEALRDTVSGSLEALGILYGNVDDFSFGGRARARDLAWGELRTDSIQVTVDIADPRDPDSLDAHGSAWASSIYGRSLDSLDVRWIRHTSESHELSLYASRDTSLELDASTGILWTEEPESVPAEPASNDGSRPGSRAARHSGDHVRRQRVHGQGRRARWLGWHIPAY